MPWPKINPSGLKLHILQFLLALIAEHHNKLLDHVTTSMAEARNLNSEDFLIYSFACMHRLFPSPKSLHWMVAMQAGIELNISLD